MRWANLLLCPLEAQQGTQVWTGFGDEGIGAWTFQALPLLWW